MPQLLRPCGAKIYYETKGSGAIPILLLAPGGMRSSLANWETHPYNPWKCLDNEDNKFQLIGMDQRFANRSTGQVQKDTGWHTFLQDQLALLDHLEIQHCHLMGSCIGPSYAFQLLREAPTRFGRCVMLQPIGLAHQTTEMEEIWTGLNQDVTWRWVGDWAKERIETKKGEEDPQLLKDLHDSMFGPPRDFGFSISRQEAAKIDHELLVLMGKDIFHPSETSREIVRIVSKAELIEQWRDAGPTKLTEAADKIEAFLSNADSLS
jgi:pimeloyl-ACP methyl ester carboxylesterase